MFQYTIRKITNLFMNQFIIIWRVIIIQFKVFQFILILNSTLSENIQSDRVYFHRTSIFTILSSNPTIMPTIFTKEKNFEPSLISSVHIRRSILFRGVISINMSTIFNERKYSPIKMPKSLFD